MLKAKKKFSVSVSADTLERLRTAAAKESISVNSLINRTLESFAIWNLHNAEFVPIRKALVVKLLERFTREEIGTIAESLARTKNKDTVIQVTNHFDTAGMLKTFEAWLHMTGFPYSHNVKGSVHRFVILHDLGDKWSVYLAKLTAATLDKVKITPKFEYTSMVFSITIDIDQAADDEKRRTEKQIKILDAALKKKARTNML